MAGCTWTAHSLFGRPGNNPYCQHRALDLRSQGLRERIVPVQKAPGEAFDCGLWELVLESIPPDNVATASTPSDDPAALIEENPQCLK